MRCRASACALLMLIGACGGETPVRDAHAEPAEPDASLELPDSDHDGLCDFTEDELGTDPNAGDSDRDGLPDLIELSSGFDATDPEMPAAEQIGYLEARQGGSLEFPVRATVNGDGQGISGSFQALTSFYGDGLSAADFFTGAAAISALPVDGVRSINEGSAYFAAVLGRTRLVFSLHFEYPYDTLGDLECAHVYPFRYAVKTDDGQTRAERGHLLIVVPAGSAGPEAEHCLPQTCH